MSLLVELSESVEGLVLSTSPSVVSVERGRGQGSGVVIAQDGYVVTNSHVIAGAREARVRFETESERAEVVGDDRASDIAILRLNRSGLPSLPLFSGRRVRVGQLVLAIGSPLRFERSVSLGVVSAIDRALPRRGAPLEGLVQTDAAINPGSSGGPLLDAAGTVVGINTAVVPRARGIGFAIPAHTVSWVVAMLLKHGRIERPRLGLAARGFELGTLRAQELGQPRAVRVMGTQAGKPAERGGLLKGDVLLRANGQELGSVDDLVRTMVLGEPGELTVDLLRGTSPLQVGLRPEPANRAA